jgi:transcriptional regulator GlxA family with amidase domain
LFVIDGDRLTCSGGTAALDMMHALIEQDHGPALAAAVSDWFLQTAGFASASHFSNTYRRAFGISPRHDRSGAGPRR